ncbi:MAG: mercuric transporter MerT family protein [Pseudomonadota bacterium]
MDAGDSPSQDGPAGKGSAASLALAGIAALLSSTCCVLPLALVLAGVSGTWMGQLRAMEPYSEALTVLAAVALAVAGWRLYGPAGQAAACDDSASCRRNNTTARKWFWAFVVLTALPVVVQRTAHFFY